MKFTVFLCEFDSPQVKKNLISSTTSFVNKFPKNCINSLESWESRKWKNKLKLRWTHRWVPSLPSKIALAMAVKTYAKAVIKVFLYCQIWLILSFWKAFFLWLSVKSNLFSYFFPIYVKPEHLNILKNFESFIKFLV